MRRNPKGKKLKFELNYFDYVNAIGGINTSFLKEIYQRKAIIKAKTTTQDPNKYYSMVLALTVLDGRKGHVIPRIVLTLNSYLLVTRNFKAENKQHYIHFSFFLFFHY